LIFSIQREREREREGRVWKSNGVIGSHAVKSLLALGSFVLERDATCEEIEGGLKVRYGCALPKDATFLCLLTRNTRTGREREREREIRKGQRGTCVVCWVQYGPSRRMTKAREPTISQNQIQGRGPIRIRHKFCIHDGPNLVLLFLIN
jgi:hypothetical protein